MSEFDPLQTFTSPWFLKRKGGASDVNRRVCLSPECGMADASRQPGGESMPYSNARYWMLLVIAVIIVGFWPSYWSTIGNVPWQFHAHGAAASLWVMLVTVQCWTSQSKRQLELHRAIGRASVFVFPFLIAGLFGIIDYSGKNFIGTGDPVRKILAGPVTIGMAIAASAYVTVFYRALKYRRKVWVHAGYMLSTPLILFESPFSRILNLYVPGFVVTGPATFDLILSGILWSIALELLIIAFLWWRYREQATPFIIAGMFVAAQLAGMGLTSGNRTIEALLLVIGRVPSAVMVAAGFALGTATSWLGWQAGKPARVTAVRSEPQPA